MLLSLITLKAIICWNLIWLGRRWDRVLLVHLTDSGKFLAAGPMRGSPGPSITLAPASQSRPPPSLSCCY